MMRPSLVLKAYCSASFAFGMLMTVPLMMMVRSGEYSFQSVCILTACLNVVLLMILPLILDWSERKYFKARFVQLEELAETNPELKAVLDEQCKRLALPGLRLAAVEMPVSETFTYGLWRQNPRLVVPSSWLQMPTAEANILPSIEYELNRFAKQDVGTVWLFAGFCATQALLQFVVLNYIWH